MMKLNVGIVAGRRPNLLATTLQSFQANIFDKCVVEQVRVNLDPIFGDDQSEADTIQVIRNFFPSAEINTPVQPNFCKAVQWIWSGMQDGPFLHLEDDWVCIDEIPIQKILEDMSDAVKMILLLSETHGKRGLQRESVRVYKSKIFGLTCKRRALPTFGTSPSITDGRFARRAAALFDLTLDPEKQMRDNRNPKLIDFLNGYRCLFQASQTGTPLIEDIGRAWQSQNNVEKVVEQGVSKWIAS